MATSEIARDGYQLIRTEGILDGLTEDSVLLSDILQKPSEKVKRDYVLDMTNIEYMNSSMLGMLVRFLSSCQEADKRFILMKPSFSIKSLLEMIGLTQFMTIVNTEEEAVEKLGVKSDAKQVSADVNFDELAAAIELMLNPEAAIEHHKPENKLRNMLGM